MTTTRICTTLLIICLPTIVETSQADDKPPRAIDDRLKIELFAEHPDIVTPTGIDVDHQGRVWAIESNTHFPPAGYNGHPSDRILVMQDTTGDHKADKFTVFADGLKHTMSIAVRPVWLMSRESRVESREQKDKASGRRKSAVDTDQPPTQDRDKRPNKKALDSRLSTLDIFIATRRAIWLYTDTNGDLKADKRERIVHLDTKGDYPHNGLAGFAFDAMGWMYFGFGENLGADYKIIGSDGTTLKGGGEGGNVYRCRPDGSKLSQWATGFWNPHASCVDAFGRLFTVDNDPDSRPPCRLLHVIEGGDYGFRFRNGRKGLHPFTAWNGEIPGTLPMVSGTGEAPSGIVAYESDGFPKDYIGNLLVGSWGDHRIDRFRLKPRGASFESLPETIIQGGENFRPVGLAVAPDGSLYLTDWVKRDYKLHGHGRVWRVSARDSSEPDTAKPTSKDNRTQPKSTSIYVDAKSINAHLSVEKLKEMFKSRRLNVRRMAAIALSQTQQGRLVLLKLDTEVDRRTFLEAMRALRQVPKDVEDFKRYRSQPGTPLANLVQAIDFDEANWVVGATSPEAPGLEFMMRTSSWGLTEKKPNSVGDIHTFFMDDISTNDPFLFATCTNVIANANVNERTLEVLTRASQYPYDESGAHLPTHRHHLAYLIAARKKYPKNSKFPSIGLGHKDSQVRCAAVQWVAEENLKQFRPQVEAILNSETMTTDLFLATLAALEMLDGKDPKDFDKTPAGKYVLPLVKDANRSPAVRAQALRLVDGNDLQLEKTGTIDTELIRTCLDSGHAGLRLEAVRSLTETPWFGKNTLLMGVAGDQTNEINLRAEAMLGLSPAILSNGRDAEKLERFLFARLTSKESALQIEALRALRESMHDDRKRKSAVKRILKSYSAAKLPTAIAEQIQFTIRSLKTDVPDDIAAQVPQRPSSIVEWNQAAIESEGNPAGGDTNAGRRTFFHPNGAGCYKCHTVNGRGGKIGPDLSRIGGALNRKRLAESILEPSKEIAPQFTNWTFIMESGKVHTGIILGDTRDKKQTIGLADGGTLDLPAAEIEERQPQKTSIMPEKLIERLTVGEFRDLLAYLESLK